MRAESMTQTKIVTSNNTIVTTTSHQATAPSARRISITIGIQKGNLNRALHLILPLNHCAQSGKQGRIQKESQQKIDQKEEIERQGNGDEILTNPSRTRSEQRRLYRSLQQLRAHANYYQAHHL